MKTLALWLSAVALTATACGKQDSPQTVGNPACPNGTSCKINVEEKDAGGYYAQFDYRLPTNCEDQAFRFTSLKSTDRTVVAKTTDGDDIIADVQLFITDDGNYTGTYSEKTLKRIEGGVIQTTAINNQKEIKGTWAIQSNKIVVNGIGQGEAVRARGFPGIQFTLQDDQQLNPTLKGKQLSFITSLSKTSKDGKSVADACVKTEAKK